MNRLNIKNILSNRKILYFTLGIILISVLSLTIVYATLSVTLNITGNSEITASNWDIHLDNPSVKSSSVHNNLPTINNNNLSFNAILSTPGDFYEFTVDVVNNGSIDAMIDSIVKTPELTTEQAKYIKYEITYENGESISTNQTLNKGTSTPIKVRVEYRKDISASDLPSTETNLSLKLTLIYVQSDGSGSSIQNNGRPSVVKVTSGDGTNVGDEVCIKEECFYVISSDTDTVTMLAKYNLYVGNIVESNGTSPLPNPTGIQDERAKGYHKGIYPYVGTVIFSESDKNYDGSIVEGYVNSYNSYLITQGAVPIEARLITKDELINLGCDETKGKCTEAPEWISSSSYWTQTIKEPSQWGVYIVYDEENFGTDDYDLEEYFGVRPVIVLSRNIIN